MKELQEWLESELEKAWNNAKQAQEFRSNPDMLNYGGQIDAFSAVKLKIDELLNSEIAEQGTDSD